MSEATVHQARPVHPEQCGAGQVRLPDRPIAIQGKVARWRKFVEVGVALQRRLGIGPRLLELFVLDLQLDLVDLQFLNEPLGVVRRPLRSSWQALTFLILAQSRFRPAAQFGGIRRVGGGHFGSVHYLKSQ